MVGRVPASCVYALPDPRFSSLPVVSAVHAQRDAFMDTAVTHTARSPLQPGRGYCMPRPNNPRFFSMKLIL